MLEKTCGQCSYVRQKKCALKQTLVLMSPPFQLSCTKALRGGQDVKRLAVSTRPMFWPDGNVLSVLGVARETLRRDEKTATEDIHVVKDLHTALLRRPAIEQLQLVCRVDSITMESVKEQYPKLCSGLGLVQRPYSIKLKPEAVPFSLHAPCRVPLLLMGKVKEEIDRMEKMGVITKIEKPTDWCAGCCLHCVDFTRMNESVCREKFILPSVEHTESAKYTTFITPFGRYYYNRLPFSIASTPSTFKE